MNAAESESYLKMTKELGLGSLYLPSKEGSPLRSTVSLCVLQEMTQIISRIESLFLLKKDLNK